MIRYVKIGLIFIFIFGGCGKKSVTNSPGYAGFKKIEALGVERQMGSAFTENESDWYLIGCKQVADPFDSLERYSSAPMRDNDGIEVDLTGANLMGVDLSNTRCHLVDFALTDLTDSDLSNIEAEYCSFLGSRLCRSDLAFADLRDTDLRHTDLSNADLRWTDLREAKLYGAQFRRARYNEKSRFPKGFNPKEHGLILIPLKTSE